MTNYHSLYWETFYLNDGYLPETQYLTSSQESLCKVKKKHIQGLKGFTQCNRKMEKIKQEVAFIYQFDAGWPCLQALLVY